MEKEQLMDIVDRFKSGLIAQATDGNMLENEYQELRNILMQETHIKGKIPSMIKSNYSPSDFRRDIQGMFSHYTERRRYITAQINELKLYIEENYSDKDPFSNLNDFSNTEKLGSGGFGKVYKYYNTFLDLYFAIKVYSPLFVTEEDRIEGEKRFFREAKILFHFNHPNIVRIFDAGRIEEGPYIKMELIDGVDINQLHARIGNISFGDSVRAIRQILNGLKYAHDNGVIHRDLKPSNIMLDEEKKQFKIIDFGISAFIENENHTKLTKTGENIVGGTFIDPLLEQSPKLRDVRSDIYSIGAIWYYLLCGRGPSGYDMCDYLMSSNKSVGKDECDLIMKCLASDISNRYASCDDLLKILP